MRSLRSSALIAAIAAAKSGSSPSSWKRAKNSAPARPASTTSSSQRRSYRPRSSGSRDGSSASGQAWAVRGTSNDTPLVGPCVPALASSRLRRMLSCASPWTRSSTSSSRLTSAMERCASRCTPGRRTSSNTLSVRRLDMVPGLHEADSAAHCLDREVQVLTAGESRGRAAQLADALQLRATCGELERRRQGFDHLIDRRRRRVRAQLAGELQAARVHVDMGGIADRCDESWQQRGDLRQRIAQEQQQVARRMRQCVRPAACRGPRAARTGSEGRGTARARARRRRPRPGRSAAGRRRPVPVPARAPRAPQGSCRPYLRRSRSPRHAAARPRRSRPGTRCAAAWYARRQRWTAPGPRRCGRGVRQVRRIRPRAFPHAWRRASRPAGRSRRRAPAPRAHAGSGPRNPRAACSGPCPVARSNSASRARVALITQSSPASSSDLVRVVRNP